MHVTHAWHAQTLGSQNFKADKLCDCVGQHLQENGRKRIEDLSALLLPVLRQRFRISGLGFTI